MRNSCLLCKFEQPGINFSGGGSEPLPGGFLGPLFDRMGLKSLRGLLDRGLLLTL